jgi:hypothetical protein
MLRCGTWSFRISSDPRACREVIVAHDRENTLPLPDLIGKTQTQSDVFSSPRPTDATWLTETANTTALSGFSKGSETLSAILSTFSQRAGIAFAPAAVQFRALRHGQIDSMDGLVLSVTDIGAGLAQPVP